MISGPVMVQVLQGEGAVLKRGIGAVVGFAGETPVEASWRVVKLGSAGGVETGLPHDGFMPLARFVRWVNDEG